MYPARCTIDERQIAAALEQFARALVAFETGDLAEQNPVGQVYFHYKQNDPENAHVVLRGETDKTPLTNALRGALAQVAPEVALFDIKSMPERVETSLLNRRAAMALCLIFAGLALLLAAVGIYGVLAYSVAQRERELGIRRVLGARVKDISWLVLGSGLRVAAVGAGIGLLIALGVTRTLSTFLMGVSAFDPLVFTGVTFALVGAALAASTLPARRATTVDPGVALRAE